MSVRDDELRRLEKYAEGLGTKIEYKVRTPYSDEAGAEWVLHNNAPVITMYTWPGQSKTRLILDCVHELAHHHAHIAKGRKEEPEALEAMAAESSREPGDPPIPKEQRKLIYKYEVADAEYREIVWTDVGIKIPMWKLHMDIELDNFFYYCYYKTGDGANMYRMKKAKARWKKKNLK